MALTTQELNTVNWEWDQGGDQWGFDPRRTSLPPQMKQQQEMLFLHHRLMRLF